MNTARTLGIAALVLLGCERARETHAPQFSAQWCEGADPIAIEPPPPRWWKHPSPCPAGTTLDVVEAQELRFDMPMPTAPMKGELRCVRPDGTAHGPATGFYESGRRQRSGCFADGVLRGRWHHFDEPGALVQSSVFAAGLPTGTWERYDGDQLEERREFESPIEVRVTHYERGRPVAEGRMVDGVREGRWLFRVPFARPKGMSATLEVGTTTVAVQFEAGGSPGDGGMFDAPGCDQWVGGMLRCIRALPVDATRVQIGRALELVTMTADLYRAVSSKPTAQQCLQWRRTLETHLVRLGCAPAPETR